MPRPDRFIPGKRPDLHCGLRHEHIITVRGIVLTLKDFTLWRGILQQMEEVSLGGTALVSCVHGVLNQSVSVS